jgi:microsomal dipeptidase-like Zn-dependent dipeptidase
MEAPRRSALRRLQAAWGWSRARRRYVSANLAVLALVALTGADCGGCGNGPTRPSEPPVVRGLADFHSHQFASLGFDRNLHTHSVDPLELGCKPPLSFDENSFIVRDMIRGALVKEAVAQDQGPQPRCYPTHSNLAGQQMDTGSLERAWEYGLRLLVVLAVNSELLCHYAGLAGPFACEDDQKAIERQLQAAKDLEAEIDASKGAPGMGWYRIVRSPAEARKVIGEGKLAVVLGIETANAFGCRTSGRAQVQGVPPLIGSAPPEIAWGLQCPEDIVHVSGANEARALALLEHYHNLGARHFFPIHNVDGLAGGAALFSPPLHAANNPSRLTRGGLFNKVDEIDRVIRETRPPFTSYGCGSISDFDSGRCNALGLTPAGRSLLKLMADYGVIIDADHMSRRAKGQALSGDLGLGGYPLISGHTGINEINHGIKRNEAQLASQELDQIIRFGGALAPILVPANSKVQEDTYPPDDPPGATVAPHTCGGTTESFIQAYRYLVDKLSQAKLISGKPAFVGVGFGSDFNGLAGWPAPRFVQGPVVGVTDFGATLKDAFVGTSLDAPPGYCYEFANTPEDAPGRAPFVRYPFTSPLTGRQFDRSKLLWSFRNEPYDISIDGVAHVGMIPDFVEELRVLGLSDQELEPLWRGAEAYIRAWEVSEAFRGSYSPEKGETRQRCRALRAKLVDRRGIIELPDPQKWRDAIAALRAENCHGTT